VAFSLYDFRPLLFMHSATACSAALIIRDLIIAVAWVEEWKLRRSSLCSFLQTPVIVSLFGPNIRLSTMFPNTNSFSPSLNGKDNISNP
jgi:hypothetical protein